MKILQKFNITMIIGEFDKTCHFYIKLQSVLIKSLNFNIGEERKKFVFLPISININLFSEQFI